LGRKPEMHPLHRIPCTHCTELFLQKILYSLHIMVGGLFSELYFGCIFLREIFIDASELSWLYRCRQLKYLLLCQEEKILYFYPYPVTYKSELREVWSQR